MKTQKFVSQAIRTKFHGATNYRGSRITATSYAGKLTLPWNHDLDAIQNHRAAAEALTAKLAKDNDMWDRPLIQGSLSDSYVFVFAE